MKLKAPFPYFGGKSKVAREVWRRFGHVNVYVEPFFGSGAVLLNRPGKKFGHEVVNDLDCMIANFWRAVKSNREEVIKHTIHPSIKTDLISRSKWIADRRIGLQERLEEDPDFFDAKIAGWWVWGMCSCIGQHFARLNENPVHHLACFRMGIHTHTADVSDWIDKLSNRLQNVMVGCGDWTKVCGGKTGDALRVYLHSNNTVAFFLDPPYSGERGLTYTNDDFSVQKNVVDWAIRHGGNEKIRIAVCGYKQELEFPSGWQTFQWESQGGYSQQSEDSQAKENCKQETIWFSPHCLTPRKQGFELFEKV